MSFSGGPPEGAPPGMPIESTPSNSPTVTVVAIFLTLSWVAVVTRMFVRVHMLKSFGWDDFAMILALVCTPHLLMAKLTLKILFSAMCVGNIEIGVVVVGHDFLNPIEISAAFSVRCRPVNFCHTD
jgi:hypothetical protein